MWILDPRIGGIFSARNIVVGGASLFGLALLLIPATPAHAALAAFFVGAAVWLRLISRDQLDRLNLERRHKPRVFEQDTVPVTLTVASRGGRPIQMLELEDLFMASLEVPQRHLISILAEGWEIMIHYQQPAERHRGLYMLGPVRLRAADPLGVFYDQMDADCITRLTVYPRSEPLPDYSIPGPSAPSGSSLDRFDQVGQGEEVLGVREYRVGDPLSRIHWRTSARRGGLHVVQLNRPVQVELAVLMDLTRLTRFGVGGDTTTEQAIGAATSILTRGYEARLRLSLAWAQREIECYPSGSGMAHLHLLLDRLAVIQSAGDADYWADCAPRALMLTPGARAVLIVTSAHIPLPEARELIEQLGEKGVGVDVVVTDHHDYIKIWSDQEEHFGRRGPSLDELAAFLRLAGARVWPLRRRKPARMRFI